MKTKLIKFTFLLSLLSLASCSSMYNPFSSSSKMEREPATLTTTKQNGSMTTTTEENAPGGSVGGSLSNSMDEFDKTKMFHALDKPLGKASEWTNQSTNIHYTVVPTEKVEINGNPFCRRYNVTAQRGGNSRQFSGTACVGADSNWQTV